MNQNTKPEQQENWRKRLRSKIVELKLVSPSGKVMGSYTDLILDEVATERTNLLNEVRAIIEEEISRQNGLRAGCPYCGQDLCDCESGKKTALRLLTELTKLENKS